MSPLSVSVGAYLNQLTHVSKVIFLFILVVLNGVLVERVDLIDDYLSPLFFVPFALLLPKLFDLLQPLFLFLQSLLIFQFLLLQFLFIFCMHLG